MVDKKFDLGDYVQVKDRIARFYELFGQGRLVTLDVSASREPDDVPRIWVKAAAYRTPDDPLPGIGWSWMELPGRTSYTKGSELENAETSAWGRAIGALGILIESSIATRNEIDNKADDHRDGGSLGVLPPNRPPLERTTHDDGLIGTVATSGTSDFQLRETPDGWILPFRLKAGRPAGQIVFAHDDLALALAPLREMLIGQRVTIWGRYTDEESPPKADGFVVSYKVLHLSRIKWADGELPAAAPPVVSAATVSHDVDIANVSIAIQEADSVALFSDDDLSDLPEWGPGR